MEQQQQANRPHRSPSAINKYLQCGEAFRRYYIENDRPPPAVAMLKGSGMHKGAEVNFRQKIESRVDLPVADIVAASIEGFEAALAKQDVTLSDDEKAVGRELVIGQAKDDVANLAAGFAVMQAPDYQPIAVEQAVRIPVPRGTHDLFGIMDLVAMAPGKHGKMARVVNDFKTAKRRKSSSDAAESTQLTFYAAGHQVIYGFPADEVRLDVLVQTTKGVARQVLPEERDSNDFKVLANRLNVVEQGIKAGVFLPAMPGSWWCSARMCNYHSTCPFVNAQRIEAAKAAEE